jgi:hypothetical protein
MTILIAPLSDLKMSLKVYLNYDYQTNTNWTGVFQKIVDMTI